MFCCILFLSCIVVIILLGLHMFSYFHLCVQLCLQDLWKICNFPSQIYTYRAQCHLSRVWCWACNSERPVPSISSYLQTASVNKQRWTMFRRKRPVQRNCPLMSAISATANPLKGMHLSRWGQTMKEQSGEVIMELLDSQLGFPRKKNLLCFCSQADFVYLYKV